MDTSPMCGSTTTSVPYHRTEGLGLVGRKSIICSDYWKATDHHRQLYIVLGYQSDCSLQLAAGRIPCCHWYLRVASRCRHHRRQSHHRAGGHCERIRGREISHRLLCCIPLRVGRQRPIRSVNPTHYSESCMVRCAVMDRRTLRSKRPCCHLPQFSAHEEPLPSQREPGHKTVHRMGTFQPHHGPNHLHQTRGHETYHPVDDHSVRYHLDVYDNLGFGHGTWSRSLTQPGCICQNV